MRRLLLGQALCTLFALSLTADLSIDYGLAKRQETSQTIASSTATGDVVGGFIECGVGGEGCPTSTSSTLVPTSTSTTSLVETGSSSIRPLPGDSTIVPPGPKPTPSTMALKRDWRIDASKVEQLRAEKNCKMMYTKPEVEIGSKPSRKTPVAWVTMPEMKFPAIQLYNTDKLSKVQCLGSKTKPTKITMEFKDKAAYDYAWNNWHNEVRPTDGDYLIITDAPGCWEGPDAGQERSFLRATTEEKDDRTLSISCNVEPIPFSETVPEDALNEIEFGEWRPGNTQQGLDVEDGAPGAGEPGAVVNRQDVLRDTSGDSDLDRVMDSNIGRLTEENLRESPLGEAGFTMDDFFGDSNLPDLATENVNNSLQKRKPFDRIKKAVKKVGQAIKKAVTVVKEAIVTAAEKIVEVAKKVGEKLNDFFTFDRSFNKDVAFDTISRTNTAVTPFNGAKGIELLSFNQELEASVAFGNKEIGGKAQLFCVECGFDGNFVIGGALRFSIGQGMEKAELTLTGAMEAGFSLGLVGEVEGSVSKNITSREFKPKPGSRKRLDKRVASISIGDFLLPGILDVGPIASLDVGVDIGLAARGKLLVGVVFAWPDIDAKIDLKDSKQNKADGFAPEVTPIFEADGEFTVSAGTFLGFKLALGVSILNGKFDFTAGVRLEPRVEASATVAVTADLNGISLAPTSDGCKGIGIGVGTSINIDFVLFEGLSFEQIIPIKEIEGPGFDECIQLFTKRSLYRRQTIPPTFPTPPSSLGNTTFTGGILTSMATTDNSFRLRWSPNGNTYAVEESKVPANVKGKEWSGWFASDESGAMIYGDSHGRIFHGYLDTIQEMGISRVRLHGPGEIPKTAWPVMFAATIPEEAGSIATKNPTMVMSDVLGDVYFPIICVYEEENVYPKLFLANETGPGIEALMSNSKQVLEQVTGQRVEECGFMPWTNFRTGQDISSVAEKLEE